MAIKDKIKWNKKYQNTPSLLEERTPSKKLIKALENTVGKNALDVACGAGKNSIYLAKSGFHVHSLDISEVALETLDNRSIKNISTELIDLDEYKTVKETYDFIVMTNFLDRNIIPKLALALKKDGILFIETYMHHKDNEKPPSNPDFLLKKDELKTFFDNNYEILEYDEFDNEPEELYKMKKQAITIKKI